MKVLSVVGARPQFVKLAPVAEAMTAARVEHVIVHTGQHYDANMSDVFFADLRIPEPDINLGVGSGTHGVQTGAMLAALDPVIKAEEPDWVLVYGDTNSTLAGALSAVKQHVKVAHLEAGLRSFNRAMPEEHNRVLTDHAADLLLAPTQTAMDNLAREGLAGRSVLAGDVMADVCLRVASSVERRPPPLPELSLERDCYVVATIHRAENTDDPLRLAAVVESLRSLPLPVVLVAHPRLRVRAEVAGIDLAGGALHIVDPLGYADMMDLVIRARGVVTDSGGLQKEAYILGIPCTTVRGETEWVETLEGDWNRLVPNLKALEDSVLRVPAGNRDQSYGDGHSADLVVAQLSEWM